MRPAVILAALIGALAMPIVCAGLILLGVFVSLFLDGVPPWAPGLALAAVIGAGLGAALAVLIADDGR